VVLIMLLIVIIVSSISISVISIFPSCGINGYSCTISDWNFHLGVLFWMSKYQIATGFCLLDRMVPSQSALHWEQKTDAFSFQEDLTREPV